MLAERIGSRSFGCYFDLANPVPRGMDTPPRSVRSASSSGASIQGRARQAGDRSPRPRPRRLRGRQRGAGRDRLRRLARARDAAGPPELVGRDLAFARSFFPPSKAATWPRLGIFTYDFGPATGTHSWKPCLLTGLQAVQLGGATARRMPRSAGADRLGRRAAGSGGDRDRRARGVSKPRRAGSRQASGEHRLHRALPGLAPRFGTSVVATETGTRHPEGDWTDSPDNWRPETWELLDEAIGELVPVAERSGDPRARGLGQERPPDDGSAHRPARAVPLRAPPGRLRSLQLPLEPATAGA